MPQSSPAASSVARRVVAPSRRRVPRRRTARERARASAARARAGSAPPRSSASESARSPAASAASRSSSSVARKQRPASSSIRSSTGASSPVADRASSRKRRPSETRSASAKYHPSVPSRIATAGSGASRAYASAAQRLSFSSSSRRLPAPPFRPAQLDARLVGECREVLGVGAAGGGEPAALGETLEHVLADGVEHVVPGDAVRERGRHDRLVDQRGNEIRDGRLVEVVRRCDRGERRERRAAAVDGKLLEQRLLVPVQEVVAPFHELLQRGAARVGGRAVAQECGAALEDGDELREPEHVHPRGGELDRERQPVHPPGDLGRERDSLGVRLEPGPCRPRTLEEELDGRRAERCDGKPHLARDVERLAARRQDPHPGTLREERRRDPRCLVEDVLARVENDERAAHLEGATSRVRAGRSRGRRRRVRGAGRRRPRRPRARSRRARCRPGTRARASVPSRPRAGSCPRRAGPVSVTRRCSCSKRGDLAELVLAADERRRRRREIAAAPAVDRDGGDRRVVREDRLLQPPQLGPRLEPQLVGEHAPRLLERLERVRLAAAAVERQHQLPPQPLAEGVVRERRAERRRELAMLAEREPRPRTAPRARRRAASRAGAPRR